MESIKTTIAETSQACAWFDRVKRAITRLEPEARWVPQEWDMAGHPIAEELTHPTKGTLAGWGPAESDMWVVIDGRRVPFDEIRQHADLG
ncbi:MAG: hypothetical protein KGY78_10990 [Anaerolineae bacterium]|nr:hypothetical protein [Anaerolineae bacterium]